MKKIFSLMTILMVAIVSVGFVSCGDDDDEVSIVGTWRTGDSYENVIIAFYANGTGNVIKKKNQKTYNNNFKYVFDVKTMTVIFMFWDDEEGDYTDFDEPGHISSLTSTTMVLDGETFVKQ